MKNTELDTRDQEIMKYLIQNPEGLRHGVLLKKTGTPKKTLQNHLKSLERHKIIFKIKNKKKASNSTTIYRAIVSEEILQRAKDLVDYRVSALKLLEVKKGNKIAMQSSIPHILQVFSATYYGSLQDYLFEPQVGQTLYDVQMKMVKEQVNVLKNFLRNNFSKKQIERMNQEAHLVNENDFAVGYERIMNVIMGRPYYRTQDEIIRDNTFVYHDDTEYFDDDLKISKQRIKTIQDEKLKKKVEKLEKQYYFVRRKLESTYLDLMLYYGKEDKSKKGKTIHKIINKQMAIISPTMKAHRKFLEKRMDAHLSA